MATFNCPLNKQDDWVSFQLVDEFGEGTPYAHANNSSCFITNSLINLGCTQ